ncbi:MAG: dynamin family protein [Terracidiphilus sp.]|jgi:GTP-binding protein EngB required for normal cell division
MDLKEYEQQKFAIAEIVRSAQAVDTKDQALQSDCRDLLTRLAEDRFNLLVVGRFSRGKSTLMNAILGGDLLPTGIVPLTSVITTVRYGSRKQLVLNFNNSGLRREVPLSQLAEYVTQQSNPGNIKNIAYVEIELPVEILRRGFFFVDSPGLGSSISENTETTERFLPQADAFVLVTSYESPLSEEEDRILHRIRLTNKRLFVVINKQDTVSAAQRGEVIKFVMDRLERFSFSEVPRIFSISARQGLGAKLSQKGDQLEESGLRIFEEELLRFLTEDRAQSFLSNTYGRTTALLAERSRSASQAAGDDPYNVLLKRLRTLRDKNLGTRERSRIATVEDESATAAFTLQIDKRTGCGVCAAILDAIFKFLSKYQYDLTIDPDTQQEHARRGGFCPLHTWQYENISSPYGVCTAYPELTHRIAQELERLSGEAINATGSFDEIRNLPATAKTCSVCEVRIDAEKKAIAMTASAVRAATSSGEKNFSACCLPHLVLIAEYLGKGKPAQNLLHAHARLLERTAEDLQRYALRHDALRRYLTSEEERRASQLALLLLAGHRSVSAPWNVESIF